MATTTIRTEQGIPRIQTQRIELQVQGREEGECHTLLLKWSTTLGSEDLGPALPGALLNSVTDELKRRGLSVLAAQRFEETALEVGVTRGSPVVSLQLGREGVPG